MTIATPLYLFDRIIIWYCLLMILVLAVIGRPFSAYFDEMAFYAAMSLLVVAIGRYLDPGRSRISHALRLLYPIALFTFFYRETGGTMFLLFDRFLDPHLTAFEWSILGVHPTFVIDRHLPKPMLTELFMFTYFIYYIIIPAFMGAVYIRKGYEIVKSAMTAVTLTFFVSYLLFFLYPIEGPRWHFAAEYQHPVAGLFFTDLVMTIQQHGSVRGGCMPSTHFAVTLVLALYTGRHFPKWLWVMIPITVGLGIGTVWGRFHYISDVVVGGLIGLCATWLVWRIAPADTAPEAIPVRNTEAHSHHAS